MSIVYNSQSNSTNPPCGRPNGVSIIHAGKYYTTTSHTCESCGQTVVESHPTPKIERVYLWSKCVARVRAMFGGNHDR